MTKKHKKIIEKIPYIILIQRFSRIKKNLPRVNFLQHTNFMLKQMIFMVIFIYSLLLGNCTQYVTNKRNCCQYVINK